MGVGNAVGHGLGEFERIGAADQQMAGVQAQRDRRTRQHPVHFGACLDDGADVRMQYGEQAPIGDDGRQPIKVGQQRRPLTLVEDRS